MWTGCLDLPPGHRDEWLSIVSDLAMRAVGKVCSLLLRSCPPTECSRWSDRIAGLSGSVANQSRYGVPAQHLVHSVIWTRGTCPAAPWNPFKFELRARQLHTQ